MIKNFNEFINEKMISKRSFGVSRYLVNKEEYQRFLDMKGGLCLILCDDKTIGRDELFGNGLKRIDDVYKIGNFNVEPAASAKDVDDEFVAEVTEGAVDMDSKILIFARFDIPEKWDTYVRLLMANATNIIKLNNVDYSNHKKLDI